MCSCGGQFVVVWAYRDIVLDVRCSRCGKRPIDDLNERPVVAGLDLAAFELESYIEQSE